MVIDFEEFVHTSVSSRPTDKLADVFLKKASSGDVLLADGAAYEVQRQNSSLMSGPSLNTRGLGSDSFYRISAEGDVLTLASGQKLTNVTLVELNDCSCGGETEFVDSLNGIDGVRCTECGEVKQTI